MQKKKKKINYKTKVAHRKTKAKKHWRYRVTRKQKKKWS